MLLEYINGYLRPQGFHSLRTFYALKSRPSAPTSGHFKARHIKDFHKVCAVSRARVHAHLPLSRQTVEHRTGSDRSGGSYDPLYPSEPGLIPDSATRIWWCSHVGGDRSDLYSGAYARFRRGVCVPQEDISSVLLDNMKPQYLIIGPGGMGFFALLGVYSNLEDQLKNVQGISGASAGAILTLFLAVGMSAQKIFEIAMDTELKELVKYNLKSFLENYGLVDHSQIRDKLISICEGNPTFNDLKKKIYISAFNVNLGRTEYFSKDTHPDMHVIDAVCMSISVPFLFSSFKYRDHLYVDGGTIEYIPAPPFMNMNPQEVLVIKITTRSTNIGIKNFRAYVNSLVSSTLRNRTSYDGMFPTINIDVNDINIFDFNMCDEDKLKLFFLFNNNKDGPV